MEGKAFIVVCLPSGEDTLLYRRTTLKASPRGESPPQAVMRGPITRKCKQHFMLRSPSSVSLFARHLLPREKAFIVVLFSSSKTIFPHQCVQPSSPWHADRRSAQGVRSTTEGEIFKGTDGACADPDTRIFPATGAQNGSAACRFYQLDFFVTAQPSLILSWAPRKNRNPYSSSRGTDASCTCVSFSATPRNSSFTSESSSGSAIVSDGVRLPPRMRVMSVSG